MKRNKLSLLSRTHTNIIIRSVKDSFEGATTHDSLDAMYRTTADFLHDSHERLRSSDSNDSAGSKSAMFRARILEAER